MICSEVADPGACKLCFAKHKSTQAYISPCRTRILTGGIVNGRTTKGAQLQLTLAPSCRIEHNKGVSLAEWCVRHGLRLNQNIERDLCQSLKDPFVRVILKDGPWNTIASSQPLEGLQFTCLGTSGYAMANDYQYHVRQTYLFFRQVCEDNLPQVKDLSLLPERQDDRNYGAGREAQELLVVFGMRRVSHNCLSPPARDLT